MKNTKKLTLKEMYAHDNIKKLLYIMEKNTKNIEPILTKTLVYHIEPTDKIDGNGFIIMVRCHYNDHDLTTIFKDEFSKTLDVSNYDVNIKPSRALKIYMI